MTEAQPPRGIDIVIGFGLGFIAALATVGFLFLVLDA